MKTLFQALALAVAAGTWDRCLADGAYADGFEGGALDPFWTAVQGNGTIQPSTLAAHAGTRSARMVRSTTGQLTLQLNHLFSEPQFGDVSVWFYGNETAYYSYLTVANTGLRLSSSVGVQDWDSAHFYYNALNGSGGAASVGRSAGWHLYKLSVTPTNQVVSIDGVTVYSGSNAVGFDSVTLQTSGPRNLTAAYSFDDFSFMPYASGAVEITSLKANGSLSWDHTPALAGGVFSVEWAPNLTSDWRSAWGSLSGLAVEGSSGCVDVPMFFKVKARADLLMPLPLNLQRAYSVSNAVGNVFTQNMAVLNYVRPLASANEFAVMEQGGYDEGIMLLRSTGSAVFGYAPGAGGETLEFQRGFVGTTWTNVNYEGSSNSRVVSIEAIEEVTVPAGTFRCFKYHKRILGQSGSDWYEWVCPGNGLIKWVDYWVDASGYPPVTYELLSVSPREP